MTFKKIVGLAIIVGILFLFIFAYEIPRETALELQEKFIRSSSPESISSVAVTRQGKEYKLEKVKTEGDSKGQWKIAGLPESKLDQSSLAELLDTLFALELGSPIPSEDIEGDLAVYGLAEPAVVLEVQVDEKVRKLDFGIKSDYLGDRYVRTPDSGEVFLINDAIFSLADKPADSFRDKTPIEVDTDTLESIVIQHNGRKVELNKQDGKWRIASHYNLIASDIAVAELVRRVRTLEAESFHDNEKSEKSLYGLNIPDVVLSFTGKDKQMNLSMTTAYKSLGNQHSDESGKSSTGEDVVTYFVSSQYSTIFETTGMKIGDFILSHSELMERNIFQFDTYGAILAEFDLNGETVELKRSAEKGWLVNGKPGDKSVIEGFLKEMSLVEVESEVLEQRYDFKPILTIKVSGNNYEKEFEVGPSESEYGDSFHWVKMKGRELFYKISEASYSKLEPRKETLLKSTSVEEEKA